MTYFGQIDPINDIFDQIYVHKLHWNNFYKLLEKIMLTYWPKFWLMTSFLPPKWPYFAHFHQKCPILIKSTPLMTFLTKFIPMNLSKRSEKNFLKIISDKFMDIYLVENVINGVNLVKIGHFWWKWLKLGHFGGQNDVICQNFWKVVK